MKIIGARYTTADGWRDVIYPEATDLADGTLDVSLPGFDQRCCMFYTRSPQVVDMTEVTEPGFTVTSDYQDPQASPPCIFDPATGLTYWKDGSVTDIDGNDASGHDHDECTFTPDFPAWYREVEEIPSDGYPHQFWCLGASLKTVQAYEAYIREAADLFCEDRGLHFCNFSVVIDEDVPHGQIRARLR